MFQYHRLTQISERGLSALVSYVYYNEVMFGILLVLKALLLIQAKCYEHTNHICLAQNPHLLKSNSVQTPLPKKSSR
jgi:hypothetical protein